MIGLWLLSALVVTVGLVLRNNQSWRTLAFWYLRYSGGLISVLTVPLAPFTINTIKELAAYPLPVSSFADTFYKLANQSLDEDLQKIAKDYIVHYNFDQAIANASERKVVMAESRRRLEYFRRLNGFQMKRSQKLCLLLWVLHILSWRNYPYLESQILLNGVLFWVSCRAVFFGHEKREKYCIFSHWKNHSKVRVKITFPLANLSKSRTWKWISCTQEKIENISCKKIKINKN